MEEKEVKYVKVVDQKDSQDKSKLAQIIGLSVLSIFLVFFILLLFLVLAGSNNGQEETSGSESEVSEETKTIYNNILSYTNSERTSLGLSEADKIVSLQYVDSKLCVTYCNDDVPGYIEITINAESIDAALNEFKEETPKQGSYANTVINMTYNTEKEINISYEDKVGVVSTWMNKDYISMTYRYDENTLCSLSKAEYSDEGSYTGITAVTELEDKLLYEMYYYILYGVK